MSSLDHKQGARGVMRMSTEKKKLDSSVTACFYHNPCKWLTRSSLFGWPNSRCLDDSFTTVPGHLTLTDLFMQKPCIVENCLFTPQLLFIFYWWITESQRLNDLTTVQQEIWGEAWNLLQSLQPDTAILCLEQCFFLQAWANSATSGWFGYTFLALGWHREVRATDTHSPEWQ